MDVSGSPDRVFGVPGGETPWTYGGFAPGPPLGYTRNPGGTAPLVEEVREPVEPIVAPVAGEIVGPTEPIDAPMIDGDEDMEPLFSASVGGILLDDSDMDDSTMHVDPVVAPVVPSPVMTTPPLLVAMPEPSVHEVGGSSTAADVRPRVLPKGLDTRYVETWSLGYAVLDRDAPIEQLCAEMISVLEREYGLMQMIATMSKRLAEVEKRIPGPP
ncbi:hypothetical protein Tco_1212944 [Tanacetum coccineum]